MDATAQQKEGVLGSESNPSQSVEDNKASTMEDSGEWDEKEHKVFSLAFELIIYCEIVGIFGVPRDVWLTDLPDYGCRLNGGEL